VSFTIIHPIVPIIRSDALRHGSGLGRAGLQDQYRLLLDGHGAQITLYIYGAIEDFHALEALVQIDAEHRATRDVERAVRRAHLQGIPSTRKGMKCAITLANVHVVDLAAVRIQCQLREVEQCKLP
jgi:hypothetical protein